MMPHSYVTYMLALWVDLFRQRRSSGWQAPKNRRMISDALRWRPSLHSLVPCIKSASVSQTVPTLIIWNHTLSLALGLRQTLRYLSQLSLRQAILGLKLVLMKTLFSIRHPVKFGVALTGHFFAVFSNPDKEVSRFLQKIIRGQLKAVMKTVSAETLSTATLEQLTVETVTTTVERMCRNLEHNNDRFLSRLLKAALEIRDRASTEEKKIAHGFLRHYVALHLFVGPLKGLQFLQSTLESLLQRDEIDEVPDDIPPLDGSPPSSSPFDGIALYISDRVMHVDSTDMISCFWSNKLDTPCHWCHHSFNDTPPIRTFSAAEQMMHSSDGIHVRVFNRHFSCLEPSGASVVPVSHVWHPSIREAHVRKESSTEATSVMFSAITSFLISSKNAFSPQVEFWHDYFSIPQWNERIQQSLLLELPSIYHTADEILVQMSDITSSQVGRILSGQGNSPSSSMLQHLRMIPSLQALHLSQWMQRMWVILEFSICKKACIMDQSNRIWRSVDSPGYFDPDTQTIDYSHRDTFSNLLTSSEVWMAVLRLYNQTFLSTLDTRFLAGVIDKKLYVESTSLGEAVELITSTQCQYVHDRLIAISHILNRLTLPGYIVQIPAHSVDACTLVWAYAMQQGDFSPLLLQPRECYVDSNPGLGFPSWLVGYHSLDAAEWNCGVEVNRPYLQINVEDNIVEIELEHFGIIRNIQYLAVEDAGDLADVMRAIEVILGMMIDECRVLSVDQIVNILMRVFPKEYSISSEAFAILGIMTTLADHRQYDGKHMQYIDDQTAEDTSASEENTVKSELEAALADLVQVLGLDRDDFGNRGSNNTPFKRSKAIAIHRKERGAIGGEPICLVKCPGCSVSSLLRLDLRTTATIGAKVYRIPGLTYSRTVKDGVGLVLQNDRIVGRMLYGAPCCDCRLLEHVQIR